MKHYTMNTQYIVYTCVACDSELVIKHGATHESVVELTRPSPVHIQQACCMHQTVQHTLPGLSVSSMSSTLVVQSRTPNPGHIEMAGQDCNPAHTTYIRIDMIWRLKLFWCMYTRSIERCSVVYNLLILCALLPRACIIMLLHVRACLPRVF